MEVKKEIFSRISNDKVIQNYSNEKTENLKNKYDINNFSKDIIQGNSQSNALIEPTTTNLNLELFIVI